MCQPPCNTVTQMFQSVFLEKLRTMPRPIISRLELIVTILAGYQRSRNFRVFAHATSEQIQKAIRTVSRFLFPDVPLQYNPRRAADVASVVRFLDDYPEVHQGNIVGLANKAIRWHRRDRQEEVQRQARDELGESTPTAKPPVQLPDIPGVRFLATVGEVVDEGKRMNHCVASYAKKAKEGLTYLFHIDHEGDEATIEVCPQGVVLQAQGPKNVKNKATAYGTRVLSAWAGQFKSV
jgi:PcfJ-like protein